MYLTSYTYIHRHSQNTPRAGTPGFRAPEVLLKSPQQTTGEETPAHATSREKIIKIHTYIHTCMHWAQHELQETSCFDLYVDLLQLLRRLHLMDLPCHLAHTMNLYGRLCGCVCLCVLRTQHHFPNRPCCFTLKIPTYAWYSGCETPYLLKQS